MLVGGTVLLQIAQIVFENLEKCEDDIYRILAATSNLSAKGIKELPIDDFLAMVVEFIKLPQFAAFFSRASTLFK
jgi:hypothetical protein